MGLKAWFSKRMISGLVHALSMNYRTQLQDNPELPKGEAAKQALLKRYRFIKLPSAQEVVLNLLLKNVETLKQACSTAVLVELQTAKDFPLDDEIVDKIITDILREKGME